MRQMKRVRCLAVGTALLVGLSGCKETFDFLPYSRELENMALMRTMGVDAGEGQKVSVTVSSGEQSKGSGEGSSGAVALQKEAETISGACLSMQGKGVSYVFYGHVGQLLLGEELAREGVEASLDYVLRDIEMRLQTNVYLVRSARAGEAIQAAAETGSATRRLEAMENDAGLLSHSMPRSVEDALQDLEETGCTFLPSLRLEGEERTMAADGYGLIKYGRLVDWVDGEGAKGVNLLMGKVDADVLELDLPEMGKVALRIVGAKSRVEPVVKNGRVTGLAVTCRVDANLAEGAGEVNLAREEIRRQLEEGLEQRSRSRLEKALEYCRRWDADFFRLENRAGQSAPWQKETLKNEWEPSMPVEVRVEGTLRRGYDVGNEFTMRGTTNEDR